MAREQSNACDSESSSQWRIGRVMSVRVDEEASSGSDLPLSSLIAALPPSLTRLCIECNQPLGDCSLPPSLTSLRLPGGFNQSIDQLQLPATLTKLSIYGEFNQPLTGLSLSPSLTYLAIGGRFNQPLPPLPDSLQTLWLGDRFTQPLPPHPPAQLRELRLGRDWSHAWPLAWNAAPLHTLHLISPRCDIGALDFPPTLTTLNLCLDEDADLASKSLPSSLKRLGLDSPRPPRQCLVGDFRGSLALQWSADARVECIDMRRLGWRPSAGNARLNLPSAVHELHFPFFWTSLQQPNVHIDWPVHVQQLVLAIESNFLLVDGLLPSSLQQLSISDDEKCQLDRLDECRFPPALTRLDLGSSFNSPISAAVQWPPLLARLELGSFFIQPLDEWQPPASLTELCLDCTSLWNQPTLRCPPDLRSLQLGNEFNQPLEGLQLPQSLTHLRLGIKFNQPLQPLAALPHLHRLELGCSSWSQLLSGDDWSLASLRELSLDVSMPPGLSPAMLRSLPPSVTQLELRLFVHPSYRASIQHMLRSDQLRHCVSERTLPAMLWEAEDGASDASAVPSPLQLPRGLCRLILRADNRSCDFLLSP